MQISNVFASSWWGLLWTAVIAHPLWGSRAVGNQALELKYVLWCYLGFAYFASGYSPLFWLKKKKKPVNPSKSAYCQFNWLMKCSRQQLRAFSISFVPLKEKISKGGIIREKQKEKNHVCYFRSAFPPEPHLRCPMSVVVSPPFRLVSSPRAAPPFPPPPAARAPGWR